MNSGILNVRFDAIGLQLETDHETARSGLIIPNISTGDNKFKMGDFLGRFPCCLVLRNGKGTIRFGITGDVP